MTVSQQQPPSSEEVRQAITELQSYRVEKERARKRTNQSANQLANQSANQLTQQEAQQETQPQATTFRRSPSQRNAAPATRSTPPTSISNSSPPSSQNYSEANSSTSSQANSQANSPAGSQSYASIAPPPRSQRVQTSPIPHSKPIPEVAPSIQASIQASIQGSLGQVAQANPTPSANPVVTHQPSQPSVQQAAAKTIQWWQPEPARVSEETSEQRLNLAFQQLEDKADQINQLAIAQEAAILELKAIADKVEYNWKAVDLAKAKQFGIDPTQLGADLPQICQYLQAIVPYIEPDREGGFVLTARLIDLYQAEREAEQMANNLRDRKIGRGQARSSAHPGADRLLPTWISQLKDKLMTNSTQPLAPTAVTTSPSHYAPTSAPAPASAYPPAATPSRRVIRRSAKSNSFGALKQAVLLFVGGVAVRVALDWAIALMPGLWLPALLVLMLPGAIAIYRTTKQPQTGFVWAYRLLLIMMGLILGGRL